MAGGAVLGGLATQPPRLEWRVATVASIRPEAPGAHTLVLDVPEWPGHQPGQHVDVRLTAEDGYQSQRSYSIASAPEDRALELTVERIEDGEVSPYLVDVLEPGDEFEVRGPIGGFFTWDVSRAGPLLLVGGGSGVVPLRAMLRHRAEADGSGDARLLLSARTLEDVLYRSELEGYGANGAAVFFTLTRQPPTGWEGFARRVDEDMLAAVGPGPEARPSVYVCGSTPFVESVADLLVAQGHDPGAIRAERFGPTGG
jgi:ferredoxin-NADP reductase